MTEVIRPDFEERDPGKSIIFLNEKNRHKEGQDPGTVLIELGGIIQLRYRAAG